MAVTGAQEFNANGKFVTPGWIDPHTHFDAQYSWDPFLLPCGPAGVTTAIMGNCGIGFAPCQADRRTFLSELMEAIEDIPTDVIMEGLDYDFETFEEYMDSIDSKPLAMDIGVMIGHCAVRTWVMGKRASVSDRPNGAELNPVADVEIAAMAALVRDAVAKGALGFSTSRLLVHRDPQGQLTPGALAGVEECRAICDAIAEGGGGIFEMSTDWTAYDDVSYRAADKTLVEQYHAREAGWMLDVAMEHGKKVAFSYNCFPGNEVGRDAISKINEVGGFAKGQSFLRLQGFVFAFGSRMHPFALTRRYRALAAECEGDTEMLLARLAEPENRADCLDDAKRLFYDPPPALAEASKLFKPFKELFIYTESYEPDPATESIEAIAKAQGAEPLEVIYDYLLAGNTLWKPQVGLYQGGNMDRMYDFMQSDQIIPGFGDGGAHGSMIQDAVGATHSLTHWVRDRVQGTTGRFPIEVIVKKQSADVAETFGLTDRGQLTVGMKADINVFDLEAMRVHEPQRIIDTGPGVPLERWTQTVEGYRLTLLAGVPTFKDGQPTGAMPGGLVRNPASDESAYRNIAWDVSTDFDGFVPDFLDEDNKLEGFGDRGGSAAARLMREIEEGDKAKQAAKL